MRKLSHVLPEAIARREVLKAARAQKILRAWPEIVGPVLAAKSQPDRFEQGTVWVCVQGSAWAQELRMLEPQILAKIAKACGDEDLVRELRFGVREPREKLPGIELNQHTPPDPELKNLSIREIKERRLAKWKDEEGDHS
jgi:predicted nucleic acid-binding Zn ribbon protein